MSGVFKKNKFWRCALPAIVLAFMLCTAPAHADPALATLSGGGKVGVGDKVSVTINLRADNGLWGVEGTLTYDASVLKYKSGSGATVNGGGGSVKYVQEYDGSANSKSITITFEAIGTGSTDVNLNACTISDEDDDYDCKGGKAAVAVTAETPTPSSSAAPESSSAAPTPSSSAAPSSEAPSNKNSNAKLSSLSISPGTLKPEFKPGIYNYTAEVPDGTTTLAVSAKTEESTSTVKSVNGARSIEHGDNIVTVITTAENGATLTYKIQVYCGIAAPDSGNSVTVTEADVMVGGTRYGIASEIPENDLPEGFTETTSKYNDKDIVVVKNDTMNLELVYLEAKEGEDKGFFVFDEYNSSFYPFVKKDISEENYVVMLQPEQASDLPDTLSVKSTDVFGKSLYVCDRADGKEADMLYLYMVDNKGQRGWYRYDTKYATLQHYDVTLLGNPQEITDMKAEMEEMKFHKFLITVALIAAGVVVLVLLIALILKGRKGRDDYDDFDAFDDDDDEEDDDYDYRRNKRSNPETHKTVQTIVAREENERAKEAAPEHGPEPLPEKKDDPEDHMPETEDEPIPEAEDEYEDVADHKSEPDIEPEPDREPEPEPEPEPVSPRALRADDDYHSAEIEPDDDYRPAGSPKRGTDAGKKTDTVFEEIDFDEE